MEAMGAGLPLVASRVGGVPDIVHQGQTGFLVSSDDADGYAEKVISLLSDSRLRKTLGANGRRFVQEHLGKNIILSKLEEVHRDIIFSQ